MSIATQARVRATLNLAAALLAAPALHAQTYAVQRIEVPPGANSLIGTGLDSHGHVVGWSQFFGTPVVLRSWIWTSETGVTYLTPPPGQSLLRAMDINDSDVVTGDGGFDTGVAWRYTDGTFELLGVLPNGNVSTAGGINEHGDVAGTSRDGNSFLVPSPVFVSEPAQPMAAILASGTGTYLNDLGQVIGYTTFNKAFRYTPGAGVRMLGKLGLSYDLNWAWGVNTSGDVVGEAQISSLTNLGSLPFLYTDESGMQEIGNFTGFSAAVSINDSREVVGNYFAPSLPFDMPWVWTSQTGIRFLKDLIAPSEHLNLLQASRINASGQILCQAVDNLSGNHVVVILTPSHAETWSEVGGGTAGSVGVPHLVGSGALKGGKPIALTLTRALPDAFAALVAGSSAIDLPIVGIVLVPNPEFAFATPTDASGGAVFSVTWPAGVPSLANVWLQSIVVDPSGPQGIAASNAVVATTP